MANLSQQKRERMLAFLEMLKTQHTDDDSLIALGEIERELKAKKYGLVWEEHEEAVDVMMRTHIPVFTADESMEINGDPNSEQYNFLLEGDNLHSLRLLEKTHRGKIDVIYIDPPYNLGGDFVYNDGYVGQEDSYRHSKWLSFMRNRLMIARKLLKNDGCIFISINDTEYAALKMLCDEIFSEQNYQATFIWRCRQRADSRNTNMISSDHEYILVYSKTESFTLRGCLKDLSKYTNPDDDPRGPWASIDLSGLADATRRPNLHYDIVNPETGIAYPPNPNRGWSKSKETVAKMIEEGRILWPSSPKGRPREKKFVRDLLSENTGFSSMLDSEEVGFTTDGTRALMKVLGNKTFNFPKSVKLLSTLIGQFPNKNALILDFFAGSGTTGQAVMELNQQDGGQRKFILCTNNENGICENVTYQRLKTVITGKRQDGSEYSEGIPANLMYFRTDFVEKESEELSENLLEHIREMIQLEHGVKIDDQKYVIIMTDEEMDAFEQNIGNYPDLRAVFINQDVFLSSSQEALLDKIDSYIIPDYYFDFELREAGEIW